MSLLRSAAASLFFLTSCGGAAVRPTTTTTTTTQNVALSWRRVSVGPESLSIELPGEPHQEVTVDQVQGLPTSLNLSAMTEVDGLHFEAGVHDFVAREVTNPNVLATALLQAVVQRFGGTVRDVGSSLVRGAPAADATVDAAQGITVRLRVVGGRTRVYHPIVFGPEEAMRRHAADVDRFFESIRLEADDTPWQASDGRLVDGTPWTPMHPTGVGFSVAMPGTPSAAPGLDTPWPNVDAFSFQLATADLRRRYAVLVWHFQNGGRPPHDALATRRREAVENDHAQIHDEQPFLLQGAGGRSWTADVATDHTVWHVRVLMTATTLYELRAIAPAESDAAMAADTTRFLDSFRLTD